MRRKDREMSKEFALDLIDRSAYGTLSVVDIEGYPFAIPLSLVRKDDTFYFHSAKQGKKVEIFEQNKRVCITFVGEVKVPNLYTDTELDTILQDENQASMLARKVYTTEFEAAMAFGTISKVKDETEIVQALRLICEKYTPHKMQYFDMAVKVGMNSTAIYRIDIKQITAKRKKFDSHGEEMKYGKME